jgi:ribulose-5-phosphate 4-epimerase/fuculose-1-phosphate aldolase
MSRFESISFALASALLIMGSNIAQSAAQDAADRPLNGAALPATDEERIAELVVANHILADKGVVDGFGHISVRSASNPKHYFMARSLAPAMVTRDDILEFDENSQVVDTRGQSLYGERFIHGEIYRVRPDVNSVVHSHTNEVLPFTVTKAPLRALIHVAAFLGTEPAPVFDIRDSLGPDNLMLVNTQKPGADLARTLGNRSVVLMRGHGMAVAAPTIRDAVLRAIYTRVNAQVETEAMKLGTPVFMNRFEVTRIDPVSRQWAQWASDAEANRKAK